MRMRACGSKSLASHALRTDADHFAGFDIIDVLGVDQIEGAGLRREDISLAAVGLHFAKRQGPESVWIACHDDAIASQEDERKCTFQLQQSLAQRARQSPFA